MGCKGVFVTLTCLHDAPYIAHIVNVNHLKILIVDLQMVNISLRVLARPDQSMLPSMYRQLGQDFDERVLPSICNEVNMR